MGTRPDSTDTDSTRKYTSSQLKQNVTMVMVLATKLQISMQSKGLKQKHLVRNPSCQYLNPI